MKRPLLFNHIPKTGGVSLRVILHKYYEEKQIFQIKSTDIGGSLNQFSSLSPDQRAGYAAVSGHGAVLFLPFMDDPFLITILREPISLFLSQFYYLKNTIDAGFYEELKGMESLEDYIPFAIENGQDNLMTRYLSGAVPYLANPSIPVKNMDLYGPDLLEKAVSALHEYDAVIDLADFDAGVFALAKKLNWNYIPLYRQKNRNKMNPGLSGLSSSLKSRLEILLRFDLALYSKFQYGKIAVSQTINRNSSGFRWFKLRQKVLGKL